MQNVSLEENPTPDTEEGEEGEDVEDAGIL